MTDEVRQFAPGAKIVNVTDLHAGDVISVTGREEDAETVLAVQKKSGYSLVEDKTIKVLTNKGWMMEIGRDSQVLVLRQSAE